MDKDRAHKLAAQTGVRVSRGQVFPQGTPQGELEEYARTLGWPLFVKPVRTGSSTPVGEVLFREVNTISRWAAPGLCWNGGPPKLWRRLWNGWSSIVPVSGWRSFQEQEAIYQSSLAEHGRAFTQAKTAVRRSGWRSCPSGAVRFPMSCSPDWAHGWSKWCTEPGAVRKNAHNPQTLRCAWTACRLHNTEGVPSGFLSA